MKKQGYIYKNSSKNDFVVNLLIIVIAALLIFMGIKFFKQKGSIVVFALSIAFSYCRIAVEAIEKLLAKKFDADIISTVAVLVMFASQEFKASAIVAIIYSFSRCLFSFICADASDKLLKDDENRLSYTVMNNETGTKVFAEELEPGSRVLVSNGDYLSFSYSYDNGTGLKNYKSGLFEAADTAVVTVEQVMPYEIDFEASAKENNSKTEKTVHIAVMVYTIAMILFSLFMFIKTFINSKDLFDSLFVLGTYLLFANPATINSGIVNSGIFILKSFKSKGIELENTADIEQISRVKKVVFDKEGVITDSSDNFNSGAAKAMKIASVLKVKTAIISSEDEQSVKKAAEICNVSEFKSGLTNEAKTEFLAENSKSETVLYVTASDAESSKNVITFSTSSNERKCVDKTKLNELVKSIKQAKMFRIFAYIRLALGAICNLTAVYVFVTGMLDKYFNNRLVELEGLVTKDANGQDKIPLMKRIIECLLYNDTLAPWVIACMHIVIINLFLVIAAAFLNNSNNNKKLR